MKKMVLKISAVAIAVAMLAGCGGGNETDDSYQRDNEVTNNVGNNGNNNNESAVDVFGRQLYDDRGRPTTARFNEVPMDLNGRIVVVATSAMQHYTYAADVDATPNETLDIMRRLREIEEDYNMEFLFEPTGSGGAIVDRLLLLRSVGETHYDIVNMGTGHTALDGIFTRDVVMDLYHSSVSHILDFENNPWRPEKWKTHMFGRQHGVHFLTANSGALLQGVLTFNVDYVTQFGLPNLYDMVFNKTWNFNAFEGILNQVNSASNGNVTPMTAWRESNIAPYFIIANGGYLTRNTPEGKIFVGHYNDEALEAMTFLARLVEHNLLEMTEQSIYMLAAGQSMFASGPYENLRRLTRQDPHNEFRFGLLPVPMGNHLDDFLVGTRASDQFYIVQDIPRPAEIAAILVAMANRLSKINIIETELYNGLQDEYSAQVMEMLLDRIVPDYSRLSQARNSVTSAINLVLNLQMAPRPAFEAHAMSIQANYDSLNIH